MRDKDCGTEPAAGCDARFGNTPGGPTCGIPKLAIDPDYYKAKQAQECVGEYYANPRHLLDQEIDRLNRQVNRLYRLRRALPEEMHHEAEKALCDMIVAARGQR